MQDKMYSILVEQTTIVPNSGIEILEESGKGQSRKVSFKSRLQEANVKNANKRYYDNAVCETIIEQLGPKAKARNLLTEVDHPMFNGGDPASMKKRAAVIELKNCGAVIRDIKFHNGEIMGEMETLTSFRGPDLTKLITDDKVDIGWSLRALGAVSPMSDGTLKVMKEIRPITYDIVSNPSHQNSKIVEFLPESDMSMLNDNQVLAEETELSMLNEQDEITICEGNYCVKMFMDDYIKEQFNNIIGKGLRFRI